MDQGTFFGGQIAQMYENAIARYGEAKVVENIMKVIQNLHGLSEFKISPLTEKALVDAFKASPAALIAFRKKLTSEGDSGMSMLYAGTEYAKMRIDEIKSEETRKKEAEKLVEAYFKNPENFKKLEQFDSQVKEKQKADLDQVRKNLEKIKNSDTFNKLNSKQKAEIENLLAALSVEKLEFLLNSQQMKEARKGLIISGV